MQFFCSEYFKLVSNNFFAHAQASLSHAFIMKSVM
jgi:hypothetical protein